MRVLVVGHPRSATTWVGEVLGATAGAGFVPEPDHPRLAPFAIRAMAGQGSFPVLGADDSGSPALNRLWDAAFGAELVRHRRGTPRLAFEIVRATSDGDLDLMRSPAGRVVPRLRVAGALSVPMHVRGPVEHHVVKSVWAPLMIEWIVARWSPAVVICFRHPLDVVASFVEMGLVRRTGQDLLARMSPAARSCGRDTFGVPEPEGDDPVPYVAWQVGVVMSALDLARRRNPAFHVVEHDDLCTDPIGRFRELVDAIGLRWAPETEARVAHSDQPGTGYETKRVARAQKDRWRARLDPAEIAAARAVLGRFPIATRYPRDLAT